MEREEKVREREREKQEVLRVTLKGGILVGKRGGTSTPSPTWRFGLVQSDGSLLGGDFNLPSKNTTTTSTTLSARKLCANLWETQPQPQFKVIKMDKNGGAKTHHHLHRDNTVELLSKLAQPHDSPSEEPTNEDSLGKRFTESPKQDRPTNERNGCNSLQPSSLASYSSSMEVAPYNPAITPTGSLKLKGGFGESSYSLKTSTELLKVLNRIWSLEEQHASNISLVKALRKELIHSQTRIKELLQDKQRDQQEIDYLKNKMADFKVPAKCKEQDQTKDVIRSLRNELEDERKLRKHSESFHRKLAREFSKLNSSFSTGLKELEKERSARVLLEELCDELALGIIEYEQEVRLLRQKKKNDRITSEHSDRLILHLSEAWMDGRMQMKQAELCSDLVEKKSVVEKLSCEIETFLRAKRTGISRNDDFPDLKEPSRSFLCRQSLESIHLNEAVSTPRRNKAHSTICDLNNFELNRGSFGNQINGCSKQLAEHAQNSHVEEKVKPNPMKKKVQSIEARKEVDVSNMQMQFEERVLVDVACKEDKTEHVNSERAEMRPENIAGAYSSQKLDTSELKQEDLQERKDKQIGKQISLRDNLLRTKSLPTEVKQIQYESIHVEDTFDPSKFTGPASPVEKWTTVAASGPEISEASLRQPQSIKENTLRAKLLEARLESRSRTSKGFPLADQVKC